MSPLLISVLAMGGLALPPADTVVWLARGPETPRFAEVEGTLSLGGVEDDDPNYNFYGVTGWVIGRDGSMVVLQAGLHAPRVQLRMYDSHGRFVRDIGRVGQGPGEYTRPTSIAAMPDGRLLLTDLSQGRMTVYSAEGDFEEAWSLPLAPALQGRVQVSPDGIVALEVRTGTFRDSRRAIVRLAPGGAVIDTIQAPDLPELGAPTLEIRDPPRTITLTPPFYPRSTWTWHPHGYFVTARTDRYAVDLLLPRRSDDDGDRPPRWREGDPIVSIRAEVDPVPLHPEERRDHERSLQERLRAAPPGERTGSLGAVPEVKPILNLIHVADDLRIWVALHAESVRTDAQMSASDPGDAVASVPWRGTFVYDVFEPNGTYLGRVSFPSSLGHPHFRGDEVWGFDYDELGVPTLRRYRIRWPDPA